MPMGIPAPEGMQETNDVATVEGMRRAIFRASRDSALIHANLYNADMRGLSGEDRYVVLAYNALVHLESLHQQMMQHTMFNPDPPAIFTDKKDGKGYT